VGKNITGLVRSSEREPAISPWLSNRRYVPFMKFDTTIYIVGDVEHLRQ